MHDHILLAIFGFLGVVALVVGYVAWDENRIPEPNAQRVPGEGEEVS